jgi:hypothetical protein
MNDDLERRVAEFRAKLRDHDYHRSPPDAEMQMAVKELLVSLRSTLDPETDHARVGRGHLPRRRQR